MREREKSLICLQLKIDSKFFKLTGLAQRRVVKITPIKGVMVMIFEVNLGKNSFDRTAKQNELELI